MTNSTTDFDLDEDQGTTVTGNTGPSSTSPLDADIVNEDADSLDRLPERAIQNDNGSVTLPLLFPVSIRTKKNGVVNEHNYEALTFYRLTGKDQRVIGSTSSEKVAAVAFACSTRLSQVRMDAIYDRMDAADISDAGRVLNSFLTIGRRTGQ